MRRSVSLTIGAVTLVAAGAAAWLATRGVETGPTELTSALWRGATPGGDRYYFVTSRTRTSLVRSGRWLAESVTTRTHELRSRAAIDGSDPRAVALQDDATIEILGVAGDRLWMWQEREPGFGLEGRDLETLEVLMDGETIAAANPDCAGALPDDARFVTIAEAEGEVRVRTLDARELVLAADGTLRPYEPPPPPSATDAGAALAAWLADPMTTPDARALPGHDTNRYLSGALPAGDAWFGMLSAEERGRLSKIAHRGAPPRPYGDVRRGLFRFPLVPDPWNEGTELDLAHATPVTDARFLKGAFLTRPGGDGGAWVTWEVEDPASGLVFCRASLSDDAPWRVVRLALDGRELWTADLGIADISHVLPTRATLVIAGFADHCEPRSTREHLVVSVDVRDGAVARGALLD